MRTFCAAATIASLAAFLVATPVQVAARGAASPAGQQAEYQQPTSSNPDEVIISEAFALAAALGGEDGIQAEFANAGEDGLDVAVGESFLRAEQILRRDQRLIAQEAAESFDFLFGPMGEISQGALVGFAAFPVAFAEEDGGRGVAVGDGCYIHVYNISIKF